MRGAKYNAFIAVVFGGLLVGGAAYLFAFPALLTLLERNSEPTRFTDIEAGFNGEMSDEEDPILTPESITLPQIEGSPFFGWGQYWQDLSSEEERYYQRTARKDWDGFRVGIQVGHWQVHEVPEELEGLKRNGTGAQGGGTNEMTVVLEIARRVQALLEAEGIRVDLLPATIPPNYYADAFVSIHADGSTSAQMSGFKISGPRRDFSGAADALVSALYDSYEQETGMRRDSNVTRRMSSYYAFNFRRYEHALHPFVPAAIVETGFLTSPRDRAIIVDAPDTAARGIASGIINFLAR